MMRKNEYNSLEEFVSQYTGVWGPSDGHWFGLDFAYHGREYRFNTGSMYNKNDTVLPDGRTALFGIYEKLVEPHDGKEYVLLGEYANMDDVLTSTVIANMPFRSVIMADETEILGQD